LPGNAGPGNSVRMRPLEAWSGAGAGPRVPLGGPLARARGAGVLTRLEAALMQLGGDARRRAAILAATVLCLLMTVRLSNVLLASEPAQVPFTVALFVLPVLCAFPASRGRLARRRWLALTVQAALTWVPFALFGGTWQQGIDGLLAGLVLLLVAAPVSWLVAGGALAAEVTLRAAVTGLPEPGWYGVVWVVTYYVDDALVFFGLVRLAQLVSEVEDARGQAAALAVARERLRAGRSLEAAVGERLTDISGNVAAARRALARDAAGARAQVAAAGAAARAAVADARALAIGQRAGPGPEQFTEPGARTVIGARLAWAVLVTVVLMFGALGVANTVFYHLAAGIWVLSAGATVAIVALQVWLLRAVRDGERPRRWPALLAVQAALVYAFSFGFSGFAGGTLSPFVAGLLLLLMRGWRRWAAFGAVVVSSAVLYAALPMSQLAPPFAPRPVFGLFWALLATEMGLLVYGLSRLVWLARELEGLRQQLARLAGVRERLRVARDVHDLLGLGLSAVALKADLVNALIGRDDQRAEDELDEMGGICAVTQADICQVTGQGPVLSLSCELRAAKKLLASFGIEVQAGDITRPLPVAADEVLAPVLREAVTNILRHASARSCQVELAIGDGAVRLDVINDGAADLPAGRPGSESDGHGLANLRARVQDAGGRLAYGRAGSQFSLTAELPLTGASSARSQL
jgi:two-component system sensor histidine kinase DesK